LGYNPAEEVPLLHELLNMGTEVLQRSKGLHAR